MLYLPVYKPDCVEESDIGSGTVLSAQSEERRICNAAIIRRHDSTQIKCTFESGVIEDRRKLWECLIESTFPFKYEPQQSEDYDLPEDIAQCDVCRGIVSQPSTPVSTIMDQLEQHLYGRDHHNRLIYQCDDCNFTPAYPTQILLLNHYLEVHNRTTPISIFYTLDKDLIEKQGKVLNCLIEVRRFLESRQTNSEQWPNMGTVSNVPHASNQAVNGEPEIIWLKNDGTTENNFERKPRMQSIQAIEPDMVLDQFTCRKIFGRSQSLPPTMTPNECRPAPDHNSNNGPTEPPNFGDIFKEEDEFASLDSASVNGDGIEQMRSIESFQVRGSDIMTEDSNRTTDDYSAANLLSQTIGSVPLTMPNESCSSLEHNPMTHQFNDTHSMAGPSNVSTILPPNMATSGSSEMQFDNPLENSHSSPNSNPSRDSGLFIANGAGNGVNKSSPRQKRCKTVAPTSTGDERRGKKRQLCENPTRAQLTTNNQLQTNMTPNECHLTLEHNPNNGAPTVLCDLLTEEDEFASLDSASVNGDEIEQNNSIENTLVGGSNMMKVDSNRTCDDISAANLLGQKIESDYLTMPNGSCPPNLVASGSGDTDHSRHISIECTKEKLMNKFIDDGNGMHEISFICPVSGDRIRIPAIYERCEHLQCFDLEFFLKERRSYLKCPISQCPTEIKGILCGLRINEFFADILSCHPDKTKIQIFHDGTEIQNGQFVIPVKIDDGSDDKSDKILLCVMQKMLSRENSKNIQFSENPLYGHNGQQSHSQLSVIQPQDQHYQFADQQFQPTSSGIQPTHQQPTQQSKQITTHSATSNVTAGDQETTCNLQLHNANSTPSGTSDCGSVIANGALDANTSCRRRKRRLSDAPGTSCELDLGPSVKGDAVNDSFQHTHVKRMDEIEKTSHVTSYEQLDRRIQTNIAGIKYLQRCNILPKARKVTCPRGLIKCLYGYDAKNCDINDCEESPRVILGILYCWSRQMSEEQIIETVGTKVGTENCYSDTLIPLVVENVHTNSIVVTGIFGCYMTSDAMKRHFPYHVANSQRDWVPQTIGHVWDSVTEFILPNREISPASLPLYLTEWLRRDEIRRKNADPFDEILKTVAELWPAEAKNENSRSVVIPETGEEIGAVDYKIEQNDNRLENFHSTPDSIQPSGSGLTVASGVNNAASTSFRREKRKERIMSLPIDAEIIQCVKRHLCEAPSSPTMQRPVNKKTPTNVASYSQSTDADRLGGVETPAQLEITDSAGITYLQKYNFLQKQVICQKCGKDRKLRDYNGKWQWCCTKAKCMNPVGLRANTWISNTKLSIPDILRFLYCWSRQMTPEKIAKNVGCSIRTYYNWAESLREVCAWYVYDRNPTKTIGGKGMTVEVDVKAFGQQKQWVLGAVCRETEEKWMVVVPNCESDTLTPIIEKKVHPESTIVTGKLLSDLRLKPHFKDHCPVRRNGNPDAHTKTIEQAWNSLHTVFPNIAFQYNSTTFQYKFLINIAEWLWRDEIDRKERADPFDEILKTIAEFCPPGVKTHLPVPEDLPKYMDVKEQVKNPKIWSILKISPYGYRDM
ncbi:MIZ/SP-RING zinc finger domain-containing protein [Ditylenchus destructor]|uniref:MIZ/SP-RING zinc finger domain-containing protein n=1 Tax=Ditylenchus destructor TaxID=166010 RepID=A0AAD4QYC1_9BILA|nr:MIZ/SP-RING zinc finger domain-containing protein [Ditylenchus destructor]